MTYPLASRVAAAAAALADTIVEGPAWLSVLLFTAVTVALTHVVLGGIAGLAWLVL